jgi:predicted metal-dependent peptidase
MTTETMTSEELAEKLNQQQKAAPVVVSNVELKKAMDNYSLAASLLLTGMKSGQQSTGDKAFYAHFLSRMSLQWGTKIPTAGVSITDKINLYINPLFFNGLDTLQQMELLEHEIEHIVYLHPLRAKDYVGTDKNVNGRMKCANIAMDAYINENKPNLCRDLGVTYARLNKELSGMGSPFQVSGKDPWEVNYEKLMQAAKDNPDQNGSGEGFGDPIDDHSEWGNGEGQVSKQIAEGIVRDAANKAQASTGIGNMPDHMQRQISELNKATVNWRRELRKFFSNSLKYDFIPTRKRRNRRDIYGEGVRLQGRRKKPNLHIAVCLDSSGSVYDEAFSQFFAELASISDMGVKITCIDCDTAVAAVYEYDKKKKPERFGNGGTSYSPGIEHAKKLEVDGIIYFGDMDCSDTPQDPKVPFLWAVVGNNLNAPGNFGTIVKVDVERNR